MPAFRCLASILAALLLAVAPGAARAGAGLPGTVTLGKVPPRPGTIQVVSETQRTTLDLTVGGQTIRSEKVERKVVREEVLALTGRIVTRMKVTYLTHTEEEQHQGGQRVTSAKATQGKTFLVTAAAGQVTITDGSGKVLPADLELLVRKDHKEFGEPDLVWNAIPTTPLPVGADVPALARGIQRSFERSRRRDQKAGETWTVDAVSARLRSVSGTGAARQVTFGLALKTRHGAANGISIVFDLVGEITVRAADAWTVRLTLKGPLEIQGQKNAGTLDSVQMVTYP
jgi:hypothetical protein